MKWIILTIVAIILGIGIRLKIRGYFWKDKKGKKLSFKQFLKRWGRGVEGITPLQQTITTMWSFIPVFGGLIWGIVVTLLGGTYWLSLILVGSLPITIIQFISNWQKYRRFKRIDEEMKKLK